MIRGRLLGTAPRLRPFITAHVSLVSQPVAGDVSFLVDTGADGTLLSPADTLVLGIDTAKLLPGTPSTGVGGTMPTARAAAVLTLGPHSFNLTLRILVSATPRQRSALARIPSLLGRDILSHFALFFEQRTARVLLLEPHEARILPLS